MKRTYLIYFILAFGYITGCTDEDFLEKNPLTTVSQEIFFKTGNDFKLYVNQFYDELGDWTGWSFGPYDDDLGSDNMISKSPNALLNAEIIVEVNDDQWTNNYSTIRDLNIMLTVDFPDANISDVKPYLAEGRFFRAWCYYDLLRRFGGVPWINKPVDPNNVEELETPRSERNIIADSIIADLDYAINNLPTANNAEKFRLNREVALAFKSRVCLYEGTWEKYHGIENDPFKVEGSDGSKYLKLAMESAFEVINSGLYSIEKDESTEEPYFKLFNQEDYSSNNEIMFWRKSSRANRQQNVSRMIIEGQHNLSLTKDLIETYLCTDGLPISLTSLEISDDSLPAVIQNRDPRLAQTIFYPGLPQRIEDGTGTILATYSYPELTATLTGYQFRKGTSLLNSNWIADQLAYRYFRYAEVLLNYIEAKAELSEMGEATLLQNDFDISINKIRDRVDMPHFNLANSFVDPQNPFSENLPWYLVEIRRERRVELAIEGFRLDDIFRWAAADELIKGKIFRGAKYQWYVDRGWYSEGQITYVDEEGFLSPWHNTYIDNNGGYAFNLVRDYLYPVPLQEVTLADYIQNPGWD